MVTSMMNPGILIIAMDQPLDSDAQIRAKMANLERRSGRQSTRFPGLDIPAMQREVNRNLLQLPLLFAGKYMGLPDVMNYVRSGRRVRAIAREDVSANYSFADGLSLNGIFLFQHLRKNGYEPLLIQNYSLAELPEALKGNPLAVCISSTFLYLDDIKKIASEVKAVNPSVPIIVGGTLAKKVLDRGPDIAPQTLDWISGFRGVADVFIIEAHGEATLLKVLEYLGKGRRADSLTGIPNLMIFDKTGRPFFTCREEERVSLDDTAIAWGDIPRTYLRKTLSVITSQGCRYRCRFCTYHRLFPEVRYKSLVALREELRQIQNLGFVRHVRFADDNFTADRKRLLSVLNMIKEERFDFKWSAFARASSLSPEVVRHMSESGCEFLNMGIESGSRMILKNMDKKLDPGQAFEAIRLLRDHGIQTLGGVIVGYPGETRATFQETVDLISKSGMNYYHPYLFYYSKDMLVHHDRERFRMEGVGWTWRHATMDSLEASRLMAEMITLIENAYTDGQQKTWETFKLLRGEGYSPDEILRLHRLKRHLQIAISRNKVESPDREVDGILDRMEEIIRAVTEKFDTRNLKPEMSRKG
jgi:p-methyltransferase